jgi:hypothetical protein
VGICFGLPLLQVDHTVIDLTNKLLLMTEIPPGPRKLRYFRDLLVGAVFLFVIGVILDEFYGFSILEDVMRFFVENSLVLFELAGFLSLVVVGGIAVNKIFKHFD